MIFCTLRNFVTAELVVPELYQLKKEEWLVDEEEEGEAAQQEGDVEDKEESRTSGRLPVGESISLETT